MLKNFIPRGFQGTGGGGSAVVASRAAGQCDRWFAGEYVECLVLKVLSLVQNSDPPLARTISDSREAIWGILSDRGRFNAVT